MTPNKTNTVFGGLLADSDRRRDYARRAIRKIGTLPVRIGLLFALLMIMLIFGGATLLLAAEPSSSPLQTQRVAFKGSGSGTFTPGGTVDPDLFTVHDGGTGSAGGFGTFTFARLTTENSTIVPSACNTGVGSTSVHGSGVMIFGDGLLFLELTSGEACVNPSPNTSVVEFLAKYKITGGTGRFEKAHGDLTIDVAGDLRRYTINNAAFSGDLELNS